MITIIDQDDSQLTFSEGTLTNVEADTGDYLRLLTGGEIGSMTTTDTSVGGTFAYDTVSLARNYSNPLVFTLMTTYNGSNCSIARVNNVTSTSFDVGIAEAQQAAGTDNGHLSETVSYLVLEDQGRYQAFDDRTIEVGTVNLTDISTWEATGTAIPWTTVNFSSAFASAPVVLAQVQTQNNGYIFLKCRITNVTTSSFDVVLERHGNNTLASLTSAETVAWVAIEQGAGTNVDVGTVSVAADIGAATWTTLSYGITFSSAPIFVAWDQTTAGWDACEIRCQNNATGSIDLTCEEDTTYDTDQRHATETVGYIALEPSLVWYKNSGNRLSPQLDLSAVGTVESGSISWTRNNPFNGDVLSFDGVDDYVEIGDVIIDGLTSFTISAWINPSSITTNAPSHNLTGNSIVGKGGAGDDNLAFYLGSGGELYLYIDTGTDYTVVTSTSPISTGTWTHVTGVYDGSNLILYVNGNQITSAAASGTIISNTNSLEIGADGGGGVCFFDGLISDARIWNYARTQAEIQADMNKRLTGAETGLVAYYKLNEGTGTTATDSAGTNDGTINGGASWLSTIIETRASLDGGTTWTAWTAATNGESIPGLTAGDNVSNGLLECRQTLSTNDPTVTPELNSLTLQVNSSVTHGANLILDSSTQDVNKIIATAAQSIINLTTDNLQVSPQRGLYIALKTVLRHILMGAFQQETRPVVANWQQDARPTNSWVKVIHPTGANWKKLE